MKIKESWKSKSGVYCIKNLLNNKSYVGSSINIKLRLQRHKNLLKNKKHNNSYLQNSWNKYGEEYFSCYILEVCNESDLIIKEQKWVDILGEYNITKEVIRNTPSEESKIKMSNTRKARIASGEIFKTNTKKIKKYSLKGEFIKEYDTIKSASVENNVSTDQIRRVLKGINSTAKGFQWKYSNSEKEILPYEGRDYSKVSEKLNKSMLMLDTYTGIYYEFNSFKECGKFFGVTSQTVSRASKNTRNLYKNRYVLWTL